REIELIERLPERQPSILALNGETGFAPREGGIDVDNDVANLGRRRADLVADLGWDVLQRSGDRLDRRVDDILEVEALDRGPIDRRGLALIETEPETEVIDKPLDRFTAITHLAHDLGAPAMQWAVGGLGVE